MQLLLPVQGTWQLQKWMTTPDPSPRVFGTLMWAWWCNCAWTNAQISFYELVGSISSNNPLGMSGVASKWKWLFVDCSTLFIFFWFSSLDMFHIKYILGQSRHVEQKMNIQCEAEQTRFCTMAPISLIQLKTCDRWEYSQSEWTLLGACSTSTTFWLHGARNHTPHYVQHVQAPTMYISMSNQGDIQHMSTLNNGGGFAAWSHCWQKNLSFYTR